MKKALWFTLLFICSVLPAQKYHFDYFLTLETKNDTSLHIKVLNHFVNSQDDSYFLSFGVNNLAYVTDITTQQLHFFTFKNNSGVYEFNYEYSNAFSSWDNPKNIYLEINKTSESEFLYKDFTRKKKNKISNTIIGSIQEVPFSFIHLHYETPFKKIMELKNFIKKSWPEQKKFTIGSYQLVSGNSTISTKLKSYQQTSLNLVTPNELRSKRDSKENNR